MARVYERPRYAKQARNKLVAIATATHRRDIIRKVSDILSLGASERLAADDDYEELAKIMVDIHTTDQTLPDTDQPLASYLLDAEIGRMAHNSRLLSEKSSTTMMEDFLACHAHYSPTRVLTDEEAIFYLLSHCMLSIDSPRESLDSKRARAAAKDLIALQLTSQKIAPGPWLDIVSKSQLARGATLNQTRAEEWLSAAENLLYRSQPMWVKYCRIWSMGYERLKESTASMVEKVSKSPPVERHKFTGLERVASPLGIESASYNFAGVQVTFFGSVMLVTDASAADYLRTAFTSLRNAAIAFSSFRLTGDPVSYNFEMEYSKCLRHIGMLISDTQNARYVARHMHLVYTRWQNAVGEQHAEVDCGWAERDEHLRKETLMYYPANTKWWDLVESLRVPERLRAEFLKLYHLLPPPDIDALLLHRTLVDRTSSANKANPAAIEAFINFCKSYDLARYLSKKQRVPKMYEVEGYDATSQKWFRDSLGGRLSLPPESDWGKAAIHREFPYDHSGDFHIFAAKDSTRVVANRDKYMDRFYSRDLSQNDTNELLSAIFNGSKLSNGEAMAEFRARVFSKGLNSADHIIAAEAGKAENTKPGAKVRETLSACDTAREILTEVDHALRPLAALTPGVSIRIDMVKHKRKFQSMAKVLSQHSTKSAIATSTDISGWSPKMPRKMFHAWQDYALSTTECPDPSAVHAIWDKLEVFVDRRGIKEIAPVRDGNIQGWPATSDTTMHAHILIFWAYKLRSLNILSRKELAYTLCLIDDAATAIAIDGSFEQATEKATQARLLLKDMYADLGFEMDMVKSFFSSIKFVYLNELYYDGAQVAHATKTLMRIDRDHARRFASVTEQIGTAYGTAASAATQGADPFVAYWMASWVSFRLAYALVPHFADLPTHYQILIAMAPPSMNGLGIRPITAVMTNTSLDELSWYLEVLYGILITVGEELVGGVTELILSQDPDSVDPIQLFRSPYSYRVATHRSAATAARRAFRDAARAQGMAEPFRSLDKFETDDAYVEAVKAMLEAGSWEAALLEEVSANMPDSFVDEVMGRVDKSELVANLLGSKRIGDLRRAVRSADVSNLKQLTDLARARPPSKRPMVDMLRSKGSYLTAKHMRETMYASSGVSILNHTYPCPFALWAFNSHVNLEDPAAQRVTTSSFDSKRIQITHGSASRNLYDSSMDQIAYKGYRTVGSDITSEVRVLLYNPVRKKIAAGLAALRWAANSGAHYKPLYDLFMWSWAGHTDRRHMSLAGKQFEGSAKRVSLRHSKVNHLIMPFPNTQGAARVNARAVSRAQAAIHHMHDIMGAITALRCSTLLEAALHIAISKGSIRFAYGFTFKENASAPMEVPAFDSGQLSEEILSLVTPFTQIESDLRGAARAVTTFEAMAECMRIYMEAGTKAAANMLSNAMENEDISEELSRGHELEIEQVRVVQDATSYGELQKNLRRVFAASQAVKVSDSAGAVVGTEDVRTEGVGMEAAAAGLTTDERLKLRAQSITDSTALALANRDAKTAHRLLTAEHAQNLETFIEEGLHHKIPERVPPKLDEAHQLISAVGSCVGGDPTHQDIADMLRHMGMPGFRIAADTEDVPHSVASFCGHAEQVIGRLRRIALSLRKLKQSTSEAYSATTTIGAGVAQHYVATIITAQWRLAAARYADRADQMMKSGTQAGNINVVKWNMLSLLGRAAADSLKRSGTMRMATLYEAFVDKIVTSVTNFVNPEAKRALFLEWYRDVEEDIIDSLVSDEALEAALLQIFDHADKLTPGYLRFTVIDCAKEVIQWVKNDVGGSHAKTKLINPRMRMTPAPPRSMTWEKESSEAPVHVPDVVAAIEVPRALTPEPIKPTLEEGAGFDSAGTLGFFSLAGGGGVAAVGDDLGEEDAREAPPDIFCMWLLDNYWEDVKDLRDPDNKYAYYDEITTSKAVYDAWLDEVAEVVDLSEFEWQDYSSYPERHFDEDGGGWVAD